VSELTVTRVDADVDRVDRADLVAFLSSHRFPFHVSPEPSAGDVEQQLAIGAWGGTAVEDGGRRTLWVVCDDERVGVLRLDDLNDSAPLFDLRLAEDARGRGIGRAAVRAATDLVFSEYPEVDRFEGQTREDNLVMRRVFVRNGWTKEAHYRRAWPVPGGAPVASVAYAILRSEWATGQRVPLVSDDMTC
jgi:RimJ/RimL family protein N-acetyltransferase